MAKKYDQGIFTPKNPNKLVSNKQIIYRSSWENKVMQFLDAHPNIIQWGSECFKIPYKNPFTGKQTVYIPDFFVVYADKHGNKKAEVIEVKPLKETMMESAKSKRDKAFVLLNMAKWQAAAMFCHKHGFNFRILNETEIFRNKSKK